MYNYLDQFLILFLEQIAGCMTAESGGTHVFVVIPPPQGWRDLGSSFGSPLPSCGILSQLLNPPSLIFFTDEGRVLEMHTRGLSSEVSSGSCEAFHWGPLGSAYSAMFAFWTFCGQLHQRTCSNEGIGIVFSDHFPHRS